MPPLHELIATPQARLLTAPQPAVARAWRARGRAAFPLQRRGVAFGQVLARGTALPGERAASLRWRAAEPVHLPGILGDGPRRCAPAIDACLQMFARLRRGGDFFAELERRLGGDEHLRYAGSTIDRGDRREIERVFLDAEVDGAVAARDLWAKLAWLADDESDRSLRIRFSSGKEQLEEWQQQSERTARWVDEFAARAFPECAAVVDCAPLQRWLAALLRRPFRLSERILYNNAPGGGAVFHHDAEPGQLGVAFSQLRGHTAWFAIAKRRLARLLVRCGHFRGLHRAMAALDDPDRRLWQRLNRDVGFAALLSAHGALFVLAPGDVIALPSHGIDDVAWHSVFALGGQPSLAHSYGIFPRRPGYELQAASGAET
jgi:hypothetical protein